MKKGKFFFIENNKREQAEYQIFALYPEKSKNVDEIYEKICRGIGNVKTRIYASRVDGETIPAKEHKKMLLQELSYLQDVAYIIINKFIVK